MFLDLAKIMGFREIPKTYFGNLYKKRSELRRFFWGRESRNNKPNYILFCWVRWCPDFGNFGISKKLRYEKKYVSKMSPPDRSDQGVRELTSALNCTWFLAQTGLDPVRKPPDRSDPGVRGLASVLNGCPPFDKVRPPDFKPSGPLFPFSLGAQRKAAANKVRWSNPRIGAIRGLEHLTLKPGAQTLSNCTSNFKTRPRWM